MQTVSAPAPEPLAIAPPPQNLTETVKLVSEIKKQRRTAIVIGNANYKKAPLKNPLNDAQDIAKILKETGFSVILKLDVSQEQMEDSIREFGRQLIQGGIGLFYYAGHGVQVDGKNYLIPIGADIAIKNQKDVRYKAVDLNQILDEMNYAGNGFNIAILDACRDNPLPRSFRSTASAGLARVDGPKGTLITFATSPGSVAIDGEGRNGIFTKHLLENMKIPGLPIEQIFKRVLQGVDQESNGEQTPWMSSSFTGDFYFIP
ncbi:Caspase domain-containing protein [Desulfonema limicola]|uniref:Caspase domain-containing protein n=1 Tax=Desulfonema limicola TaxID=45656 RepID=A0A975GIE5_9BACT|nr:caspase family protein [Desulfonema limicola]QTA82515.1 Caspase domain-containing protein [Desulfonema limicola]